MVKISDNDCGDDYGHIYFIGNWGDGSGYGSGYGDGYGCGYSDGNGNGFNDKGYKYSCDVFRNWN